jgi:hypothetical protein
MSRSVRVFAGVPVRRAVAAKRGSTCLADAEMNPICADESTVRRSVRILRIRGAAAV